MNACLLTADKPLPPRNLHVVEMSKDFMVLEWEIPESDGGSPITKYKVEKRDATRTAYVQAEDVDGKTLRVKVSKLTEGNKYFFQVAAKNEIGLSDWTETSEPVEAKLPFGMKLSVIYYKIIAYNRALVFRCLLTVNIRYNLCKVHVYFYLNSYVYVFLCVFVCFSMDIIMSEIKRRMDG